MFRFLRTFSPARALLAAGLLLTLGLLPACSAPSQRAAGEKPVVLATFTVLADMAQNVAGEHIQVQSLTSPGAQIHDYDPVPSDVRKAADADLILANGLNLEAWLDQFLLDAEVESVTVSDGVPVLGIEGGADDGLPNPHAWMSPLAAQTYVDNIADAFAQLAPQYAADFKSNAESYKQQLQEVQNELLESLGQLPESQRVLVTCEGAFSYLAADAGLTEHYLWPVNTDGNPSAARVAEVATFVREKRIPAVFCETTVPTDTMRQVAAESGASYAGELYVDSLSEEGGTVPTYLDLLRYDTQVISRELGS